MTPYYERDGVTLYLADCRDVLPRLEAGSVDLLLTDPPYGQEYVSGYRAVNQQFGPIAGDEDQTVGDEGLRLCMLPLRDKRHMYAFGRWDLAGLPVSAATELIWNKVIPGMGNLEMPWGKSHEIITFAVRQAKPSAIGNGAGRLAARMRRGTVLEYPAPAGHGKYQHPTQKPVDLLRELIECSSRHGELVLDSFVGIGSTLVAAILEGRRCIGIEIEERYCEVAARRLSQMVLPLEVT